MLNITYPRILGVRRLDPLRFSVGDEAIVEFGAGLLSFLNLRDASSRKLGEGFAPEWSIAIGAALTAAEFTMTPHDRPSLNSWPLVVCSVEWQRACRQGEKLISLSRIEALGRSSVTQIIRVYSDESREQILQGKAVSVAAGPQGPVPFIATFFGPDETITDPEPITTVAASTVAESQLPANKLPLPSNPAAPLPQAIVAEPKARSLDGKIMIYPLEIPEPGLPISPLQPLRVLVQAPSIFQVAEINRLIVRAKGRSVATVEPAQTGSAQIEFLASGREGYELVIHFAQARAESLGSSEYEALWSTVTATYEEAPEAAQPDLFHLAWPRLVNKLVSDPAQLAVGDTWEWLFPADLFKLLINPIAGGAAPLGRRVHPIASMQIGTAIYAALETCGPAFRPQVADLRCTHPVYGRAPFSLRQQLLAIEGDKLVFVNSLSEAEIEVAQVRLTLVRA